MHYYAKKGENFFWNISQIWFSFLWFYSHLDPGPQIGSIVVEGMLAPAEGSETNTETVMENFKENTFKNFRHRLSAENGNIRLKPDTSEDYDGFTWIRSKFFA